MDKFELLLGHDWERKFPKDVWRVEIEAGMFKVYEKADNTLVVDWPIDPWTALNTSTILQHMSSHLFRKYEVPVLLRREEIQREIFDHVRQLEKLRKEYARLK